MKSKPMHPRDELSATLTQIYNNRMTTASGGNLSIKDANGDIWITPAQVDKGCLSPEDIVCVCSDGSIDGKHAPSSELPFHQAIYDARPDIQAIIHAHPPALVSFSCAHKVPDTRVFPDAWKCCGKVGFAKYGEPGSSELGQKIAIEFQDGFNCIVLENHGVCCGGNNLAEALQQFETLELCAEAIIRSVKLGEPNYLSEEQLQPDKLQYETFDYDSVNDLEKQLREELAAFVNRGYQQGVLPSSTGTFSVRVDDGSFLVTPSKVNRALVTPGSLVLVREGKVENGKTPSRMWQLHCSLYEEHPKIQSIVHALPVNALAFSVVYRPVDTHIIPESYMLAGSVAICSNVLQVPDMITPNSPAVVIKNDGVIVVGESILSTFDRLEVLENAANSIVGSLPLGGYVSMPPEVVDRLPFGYSLK